LEVNQPRELLLARAIGRIDWSLQTTDAASKESQIAIIGLTVVHRHIKEQLCHAQLPWTFPLSAHVMSRDQMNEPGILWNFLSINFAAIVMIVVY
jgi:hypothetical protein